MNTIKEDEMILPKYQPGQWVIVGEPAETAQVTKATFYGKGWGYSLNMGSGSEREVPERDILACIKDGRWVNTQPSSTTPKARKPIQRPKF